MIMQTNCSHSGSQRKTFVHHSYQIKTNNKQNKNITNQTLQDTVRPLATSGNFCRSRESAENTEFIFSAPLEWLKLLTYLYHSLGLNLILNLFLRIVLLQTHTLVNDTNSPQSRSLKFYNISQNITDVIF